MSRPALEVAVDIFRDHGPAWRSANAGHVSLGQLKVMAAIAGCRTAALGGHVARCEDCAYTTIAYNSCRNRHCPKCQGAAARAWLADREAELLPVPYFHLVFTLPAPIADIAYQNKAAVYHLLFKASAEAALTIAADPRHLGARIGITSVLHTWGSALTHHPHVHMIVPGGGIALDGSRWLACRSRLFLPWRVLAKLFRRLMLEKLVAAHAAGQLQFFGQHIISLSAPPSLSSWRRCARSDGTSTPAQRPLRAAAFNPHFLMRLSYRCVNSSAHGRPWRTRRFISPEPTLEELSAARDVVLDRKNLPPNRGASRLFPPPQRLSTGAKIGPIRL